MNRLIDVHAHLLPPELPDMKALTGRSGWISLDGNKGGRVAMRQDENLFRIVEPECCCADRRREFNDAHGVDVQVVSTVPVLFSDFAPAGEALVLHRYLNDHFAQVQDRHPDHFVAFGTVPLQDPQLAVQELHRVANIGLVGVQIGTQAGGRELDDPQFDVFWEDLGGMSKISPIVIKVLLISPAQHSGPLDACYFEANSAQASKHI